jgi:hypothetical protein
MFPRSWYPMVSLSKSLWWKVSSRTGWLPVVAVLAMSGLASCKSPDGPGATKACDTISEMCHPFDHGGGIPHDCHQVAHTRDEAACAAKLPTCLSVCRGVAVAHGSPDASSGPAIIDAADGLAAVDAAAEVDAQVTTPDGGDAAASDGD